MSKQSKAKATQGFQMKPVWPICRDCINFTFDQVTEKGWGSSYVRERNLRCALGEFKVGKTSTCSLHTQKGK
jgi:hypothetical protein